MIPRVIHRIWLGGDLPAEARDFGETWVRHNPDWELRTWRDWNVPPLVNQLAFDAASDLAQKADLARLEVLLRFGGVYVDTDFEALRPLETVIEGIDCFAASEDGKFVSTGIIGSVPGHPFLARLVKKAPVSIANNAGLPPNRQTGPYFVTAELKAYARTAAGRQHKVVVFPPELFYPYHFSELHRRHEHFPDAVAVHHWSGSWTAEGSGDDAVLV